MNREILFRGKRPDNSAWVYGEIYINYSNFFAGARVGEVLIRSYDKDKKKVCTYNVYPESIGQYTGLTDKNGNKIFEGDILNFINRYKGMNNRWLCTVEFLEGAFICRYVEKEGHLGEYNHFNSWNFPIVECRVLGNIFDNPELVKLVKSVRREGVGYAPQTGKAR